MADLIPPASALRVPDIVAAGPVPADRPWFRAYPAGVPHEMSATTETLSDCLDITTERFPENIATDLFGHTQTYRELQQAVARAAEGLRLLGVKPGDRVAILLPTVPENIVAFYAVVRLSAISVEENPALSAPELAAHFADHGAAFTICSSDSLAKVAAVTQTPGVVATTIVNVSTFAGMSVSDVLGGKQPAPLAAPEGVTVVDWSALTSHGELAASHPRPTPDTPAILQYTSGTSGEPKGVLITQSDERINAMQLACWFVDFVPGEEVFYTFLPFSHVYGIMVVMTMGVGVGARIVLFPTFDIARAADTMKRIPATFLPGVPPIYEALSRAAEQSAIDLHGIKYAMSGAMPLRAETVNRWLKVTDGVIIEGYGMTEVSGASLFTPVDAVWRPGTVGVPLPGTDVRVIDPDTQEDVAFGERGELVVRGPQVFEGYWNRPEQTRDAFTRDGWLRTGDLVTMADDGYVTIVGRLKELIITGGFNIVPSEVEQVLVQHPSIQEACAVGIDDRLSGEVVAAAVVLRDGYDLDVAGIRRFAAGKLAHYKVPRHVVALPALAKSGVGKVLRRDVREDVIAALQAGRRPTPDPAR